MIMSNQGGIGNGKVKASEFRDKIDAIQRELEVPLQLFAASDDDKYRKPSKGMWEEMLDNRNGKISEVDMK